MQTPVLLLVFNRPDTTARVFQAIRAARPPRLYVAADGARAGRAGEAERCAETRRIATAVDWPCEVRTRFLDRNIGCKRAVSSAITWFFENEPEGIILEDDCLPSPSFFPYCETLLETYRDEPRVMTVCGFTQNDFHEGTDSVYLSKVPLIWGWATWRRAWHLYDVDMKAWPDFRRAGKLKPYLYGNAGFELSWRGFFNRVSAGRIDTWDFQWVFANFAHGGLSCMPAVNLITNIGFGGESTHTHRTDDPRALRLAQELQFPLKLPPKIAPNAAYDAEFARGSKPWTIGRWFRTTEAGARLVDIRKALTGR